MKRIIFFASGKGSNIQAILNHFKNDTYFAPQLIVCNKEKIGALSLAEENNIPHLTIDRVFFQSVEFCEKIKSYQPDLIILAGFLWKIPLDLVQAFPNKIINIHPALLPKFGGKGMYGSKVHEAVIAQKEKESGITIHYVNERYDEGNHICQAHCSIAHDDTPDTLATKIHQLEHFFFPRTIEFILKQQS